MQHAVNHPSYTAVCTFLQNWSPEMTLQHPELKERTSNFGVFRIAGSTKYVHEESPLPAATEEQDADTGIATCLVSGITGPVARLHKPAIKGVADAQSSGALLVSFNATAFTSYGKDQSFNAPVSQTIVFKYANALNHLLDSKRRTRLGDATMVYWADHETIVSDALDALFGGAVDDADEPVEAHEDQRRVQQVKLLLSQLRDGTEINAVNFAGRDTHFYILGLSPNASRLSVRLWVEADAGELLERLRCHVQDFALSCMRGDLPAPLWRVALATGRAEFDSKGRKKRYDSKSVSPKLAGDLACSVLTGSPYPQSLLAAMVRRIYSDGDVDPVRVSAIKACPVRNTRRTANPLEVSMELNTGSADVACRCGRLFAILEKAQTDSVEGDLNATIKDRYFSSACVTPGLVLPRLVLLNSHHLRKLPVGSKVYFDRLMGEVTASPFHFPRRLSLADQGKFIIGYFQQRQALYTKKESNSKGAA